MEISKLSKDYWVDYRDASGRLQTCAIGPDRSNGPFPMDSQLLEKVNERLDILVAQDPADRYLALNGREQLALALADNGTLEGRIGGLDGMEHRWRDEDKVEDEAELLSQFSELKQRAVENDYMLRASGYAMVLQMIFNIQPDQLTLAKLEQLSFDLTGALWHIEQRKNGLIY